MAVVLGCDIGIVQFRQRVAAMDLDQKADRYDRGGTLRLCEM